MTGLPQGWVNTDLGELAEFIMGQAPPGDSYNSAGIGTPLVKAGEFGATHPVIDGWTTKPLKFAKSSDVLICVVGATAGKINMGADCAIGRSVAAIRPNQALDQEYLFSFLKTRVLDLRNASNGTAQGVISKPLLDAEVIPLPPLPEQRRIVRKLDTLSARSTTARTHLAAIEKLVERYKLAVLRGAFFVGASGTLNEEEAAACGWDVRPLGKCLENLDNRRIPIKAEDRKKRKGPYDYYGASGVIDKIDEYLFDGRYLLIGEDGANLVARSSPIAFIAEGQFWVNNHAHVLGETHDACLDWVRLYFAAIKLEPFVTGSAQPKLTQANLNKIPVPLPTPDEQHEIVRRIETAFAKIDRLKAEAAKALKLLGHLDQRILAKAFAGDLVPQDPTDEPAETLLARIREACASAPKGKRGRKPSA